MNAYDLVVVGNGAVGTLAAIQTKRRFPEMRIAIVGKSARPGAASTAAGAMAAVYGEIEACSSSMESTHHKYFQIGERSSSLWRSFLVETQGSSVITCEDTLLFLKRNASDFEIRNFEAASNAAISNSVGQFEAPTAPGAAIGLHPERIESLIRVHGEFGYCPIALFRHLDTLTKYLGIDQFNAQAKAVDPAANLIFLDTSDSEFVNRISSLYGTKILMASGSMTSNLLSETNILPMFQGVGSAVLISPHNGLAALPKAVIRSVNRGGAQCGIHLVPRSDGSTYLGAGNYVSLPGESLHRLDTITYLINTFEKDFGSRRSVYELNGDFVVGLRPRSLDGLPMVGALKDFPTIYVATAMNRLGLTWSTFIAEEFIKWMIGDQASHWIEGWLPDREPVSFGSELEAIDYFVESRLGNALEHDLVESTANAISSKREEFRKVGTELNRKVSLKIGGSNSLVIHPDNWSAILQS